jgi:3-phenylpropionate/trans-cinnamate dioxygenase ferredoxin subunit
MDGCSVGDGYVVCPFHKYGFSLEDGKGQGLFLEKYQLKVEEGGVFIGMEKWSLF